MSTRALPVSAILAAGVGMGFAGDLLLRAPGAPGLNFTLLFAGLAASVGSVSMAGGPRMSREAMGWIALGTILGTGALWRGSELLRFLAFLSASFAFALPALHAGKAWIRQAGVADLVEAVATSGCHALFGSGRLLPGGEQTKEEVAEADGVAQTLARSAGVGLLLASVPLGVFGALFLSADPIFARILGDFVRIDLRELSSHVILIAVLSWLACGYLAGFSSGTRLDGIRTLGWRFPTLGAGEISVALGLVDLLFLGFVAVQFKYLFGGAEMVEVTPGLTYASYAREGFFQLVAATALGFPWLLTADSLLRSGEKAGRWSFRSLAGIQLILLLAIMASAVERMRVYLEAYGLTEDRFVALAILAWLAVLIVGFAATVLRGRRNDFVFGAVMTGFGLIVLLHLSNPTAYAARSHLDRVEAPRRRDADSDRRLDIDYLASLGSDATPILVGRIHELGDTGRCRVARALLERWGPDRMSDWRSWNLADWRARRAVRAEAPRLMAMVGKKEECE